MKMKRIFKMKRILIMIIFVIVLSVLGGCKLENRVIENENAIAFRFPAAYRQYLPYEEIPEFTLNFDGVIYTNIDASTENRIVFSKNDDFYLSEVIASLLAEYEGRTYFRVLATAKKTETKMNNLVPGKDGKLKHETVVLPVSGGEICDELAYIRLDNGLVLSLEYRRFNSDYFGTDKTYYAWPVTRPLNAVLHFPLLLREKDGGEKELLIVPLPDKVIYRLGVGEKVPLANILKKKGFLDVFYKTYTYPDHSMDPRAGEEFNLEENIKKVKDYYIDNHQGRHENEKFVFTYLGKNFFVTFHSEYFVIDYLS